MAQQADNELIGRILHRIGITREEFDIQSAVLLRTREKLEALEKLVEKLEKK